MSLQASKIYGCLVCGKFFHGRGRHTPAYTNFLALSNQGLYDEALSLLRAMMQSPLSNRPRSSPPLPTTFSFNSIISACAKPPLELARARQVYDLLRDYHSYAPKNTAPDAYTYSHLVSALTPNFEEAFSVLEHAQEEGVVLDPALRGSLLLALNRSTHSNRVDFVERLYSGFCGELVTARTLFLVLNTYANASHNKVRALELVMEIYREMKDRMDDGHYKMVLLACCNRIDSYPKRVKFMERIYRDYRENYKGKDEVTKFLRMNLKDPEKRRFGLVDEKDRERD